MKSRLKVGFLTYDLQAFTEDCLFRIQNTNPEIIIKAFPVFFHPNQNSSRVLFYPSSSVGSYWGISIKGSTPEGFASNFGFKTAWACAWHSDVIVLFGLQGFAALATVTLAFFLCRPIISVNQTLPVAWEAKRRWWILLLKRIILKRCVLHISQSSASREVLTILYKIPENKILDAPFEAGASIFKASLEKKFSADIYPFTKKNDETIFLFSGNLHPFKGVGTILEALQHIDQNYNIKVYFAGPEANSGELVGTQKYWLKMAKSLGVDHRVKFLGQLTFDSLVGAYQNADVVILPTQKDCFPKVLVEAAIFSKPLISTTACGAVGTILINGINGYVVSPQDSVSLSKSMTALLDKNIQLKMGVESKRIVQQVCSIELENIGYRNAFTSLFALIGRNDL